MYAYKRCIPYACMKHMYITWHATHIHMQHVYAMQVCTIIHMHHIYIHIRTKIACTRSGSVRAPSFNNQSTESTPVVIHTSRAIEWFPALVCLALWIKYAKYVQHMGSTIAGVHRVYFPVHINNYCVIIIAVCRGVEGGQVMLVSMKVNPTSNSYSRGPK